MMAYDDTFKDLTPEDHQRAVEFESEILEDFGNLQATTIQIAKKLSDFKRNKVYLALGWNTFDLWADSPRLIGMGKRTARNLIRIADELLPIFDKYDAFEALPTISTMYEMLPMLSHDDAEKKIIDAAYQIQGLTTRDARQVIREARGMEDNPEHVMFKAVVEDLDTKLGVRIFCTT